MFSTPFTCCSMGATTVLATTSALAPGYWPVTLTTGGAISGNWATGRRQSETSPRMMNTIETTPAKIGRSMKKCEMRMGLAVRSVGARGVALHHCGGGGQLRSDLEARPRPHQAVDDHVVVGLQAG